jgi:tellurite methyltransferase
MESKIKWNAKHKNRMEELKEPEVNPRLKSLSAYLEGGTALDLACGLGGNSLYLARMKYEVDALDISDVAINYIEEQAKMDQLRINPMVCDLTKFNLLDWENDSYNLVVLTYYLDRSLFPIVKGLLKENGYFFMETYYQTLENENSRVSNQYKLRPNELLAEFGNWNVRYFEENKEEGRQTIFCQKK